MSDATYCVTSPAWPLDISIHAPRERCDRVWLRFPQCTGQNFNPRTAWAMRRLPIVALSYGARDFNPRTAWAMRRLISSKYSGLRPFQSTHRVSDATTLIDKSGSIRIEFQSTHRVSDATQSGHWVTLHTPHFNPRTAWAMRRGLTCFIGPQGSGFQSTHRVSDATYAAYSVITDMHEFQSTHRVSDATANKKLCKFYMLLILYL